MKIRALIVDDEQLGRQRVRLLLGEEPDVEVIGESGDGFEAVDQIQANRPDLVFLDVQMPDMDGFEVLRRVPPTLLPVVIFSTACDQHALRAFEVNALDYLLKPFKPARFKEAVQRARTQTAPCDAVLGFPTHKQDCRDSMARTKVSLSGGLNPKVAESIFTSPFTWSRCMFPPSRTSRPHENPSAHRGRRTVGKAACSLAIG